MNRELSVILSDIEKMPTVGTLPLDRKIRGNLTIGNKVKITWDDGKEDRGLLYYLPGYKHTFWNGVVYIGNPTGLQYPVWYTLARIASFKKVVWIDVYEDEPAKNKSRKPAKRKV